MLAKYLSLERLALVGDLQVPMRWDELFRRPGPVVLEIGFGNGEYMLRQSGLHPEKNFLGLEQHWESQRRTLRRLHLQGRDNVRLLQLDAHLAVRYLFAPGSLSEFCCLFPCPWPKRDHTRLRLFSKQFIQALHRALAPDGSGRVVTDYADFRDYVIKQARDTGFAVHCDIVPARYDTKYERRWSAEGQQEFFEIHFQKLPGTEPEKNTEEAVVKSRSVDQISPPGPAPEGLRGDLCVEFKRRLFDPEQQVYMFLVIATEDGLSQSFWVEVAYQSGFANKPPRWVIRPAQGSGILPTAGVQKAVDLIHAACL